MPAMKDFYQPLKKALKALDQYHSVKVNNISNKK
jgi:hypothetical protein